MINIDKLFGNLFASGDQATEIHLKNFTQDLLVRYAHYNTGGQYDSVINGLEDAYTNFFGEITGKDIKLALQQSRTRSVDIVLEKFKSEITVIYKTVSLKYKTTDPQWQEIFPHGATEYHEINKSTADTLFTRLKKFSSDHNADFEAAFITMLQGYLAAFNTARGVQLDAKEDVTASVLTKSAARQKLEKTICLAVLDLAIEYYDHPEQGRAFYNQRLLFPTHRNPQGGEDSEYVLDIPVATKAKADFELQNLPDYYLWLSNTGPVTIMGYTTDDPTGAAYDNTTVFSLASGEEIIKSYAQLGSHKYLFFYVESTDTAGEVTIDQVDAPIV